MSKVKWGAVVGVCIGLIGNFAPIAPASRLTATLAAAFVLVISIIGYFFARRESSNERGVTGNVVTAGRDAVQIIVERQTRSSGDIPDVLLGAQIQELQELQSFLGGKDESELWELFDLRQITTFNIRRAKAAINGTGLSPREAAEIDEFFKDGKALVCSNYARVDRTAGGFHMEAIPGKLGVLNLSHKYHANRQALAKFYSSHQLPTPAREAVKQWDKAVEQNASILLDVINEKMAENPQNIFREEDGNSPLFGATSGAFLDRRIWLKPKQEKISDEVRRYLNIQ
jgi:hypothetical protein